MKLGCVCRESLYVVSDCLLKGQATHALSAAGPRRWQWSARTTEHRQQGLWSGKMARVAAGRNSLGWLRPSEAVNCPFMPRCSARLGLDLVLCCSSGVSFSPRNMICQEAPMCFPRHCSLVPFCQGFMGYSCSADLGWLWLCAVLNSAKGKFTQLNGP